MAEKRNFDKEAARWDENPVRVKLAKDIAAAMLGQAPDAAELDAMDFGCGTGLLSLELAPHVRTMTAVDGSDGMLAVLNEKVLRLNLSNVKTLRVDPEAGGALEGTFGLVCSSMTLHHIQDVGQLLRQFHAILAPGGRLCLADLDAEGGEFHSDNTGVFHFGFDRQALKAEFEKAGFRDVSCATAAEVAKPARHGGVRRFTVFLMCGRKG
ncbi:MAG TPA: class I SAM-dependent methyltransferase [Candidatus Brocadiia bacterium]|nr:class I SAM-dependent methyltransferase [Candidatus Brocadiia bacterium]